MTFKLILLLCLANMTMGSSRTLRCYLKSDSTKTFSNLLHTYRISGGRVSCGRASNRVTGRCQGSFPKLTRDYVTENICKKILSKIPSNGQGLRVPIYLSGKADCKGNEDTNAWMDPLKKADVCCAAVPFYGVFGCQRGVDQWCIC